MKKAKPAFTSSIFEHERRQLTADCNRFIGAMLLLSWVGVVAASVCLSGRSWSGATSTLHPHVVAALFLGFLVAGVPGVLGLLSKNSAVPFAIAVGQMLLVGLLTHITGGRIETHFAYFGSLALLAAYRDWRVVVVASAVAAVDHLVRGLYMPYSIFGSDQVQVMRVVEHAFWVVWEDAFLIRACVQGARQLRYLAEQQDFQRRAAETSGARVESLLQAAANLKQVSDGLTGSTEQLLTAADTALGQAATVSEQMTFVAGKVVEMGVSAKEISLRVTETSERASNSDQASATALVEVSRLVDSSQQISEVLETVQNLVFQTTLLSVNAAIEAARAGDASFAVVAHEVRQLADRSRESAQNIGQRIHAIQTDVAAVGGRLGEICNSVARISNLATNMNSSTQVQASTVTGIQRATSLVQSAAHQMLESVERVHRLSQATSDAASQTLKMASTLRDLAEDSELVTTDVSVPPA